ncbi:MAG: L-fucose mutarotase [Planctomycetaceae bacterium]|jgi:L-fucose mutarotase|nr:L-fucose mutarotase [Planctomycetaceae bacterium]
MLKGISPLISPELLKILAEMGHGDEIVLADAHFPGHSVNNRIIRADGLLVTQMLDAILPLIALDHAVKSPVIMMAVQEGDTADPAVEPAYRAVIDKYAPATPPIQRIDRFEFYERARQAYAVVMTTETRIYGNILLKKGVTPSK